MSAIASLPSDASAAGPESARVTLEISGQRWAWDLPGDASAHPSHVLTKEETVKVMRCMLTVCSANERALCGDTLPGGTAP
jgi:hypothetical protein